jgi:16S rRNA processing protein RimM
MEDMLRIGVITSPHGVHGEVKVYPTTDDVKRYSKLKKALLSHNGSVSEVHIKSVKYQKNMVILGMEEYSTMNEAEGLREAELYVSRADAVKLNKDEYFIADLIGMGVTTDIGVNGKLVDVMQTGANDVYVIKLDDDRELLLPAIADCVLDVDVESAKMQVHVLPGLID